MLKTKRENTKMLKNLEETFNNVEKQRENHQKYRKTAKLSQTS